MTAVATNPLAYNDYITQVATLAVVQTTVTNGVNQGVDTSFNAFTPEMLNYAELRIQRDADLNQLLTSNSYATASGTNVFQVPVNDFVTVQTLSINGAPLLAVAKEVIQNVYGTSAGAAQPAWFAPYGGDLATAGLTSTNFLLGPWPDSIYPVAVTGTIRAPSLYKYANTGQAANSYTFISTWLPDLLVMASMIYVSAFQRNWGKMSDDPAMALSYEASYQTLLKGVAVEEARKRFAASAWSANSPPVAASPGR